MLVMVATLVAACQPDDNQNKNKNANVNANANANHGGTPTLGPNDKRVEIYVHDDKGNPGYYIIEDPSPVTLSTGFKQRVYWCVFYDGSTPPDDVEISNFRSISGPSITNPFGNGSSGDNVFDVPAVQINNCVPTLHAPKTGVTYTAYKYTITAKVGGADHGNRDPQVVINN